MQSILFIISLNKQSRSLSHSCIKLMQKLNSQCILKLWISTLVPTRHDLISELSRQGFEKIWHIKTLAWQEAVGWAEENELLHRPVTNWSVNWGGDVFVSHHGRLKKEDQTTKKHRCFLLCEPLILQCCFCSWSERNTSPCPSPRPHPQIVMH